MGYPYFTFCETCKTHYWKHYWELIDNFTATNEPAWDKANNYFRKYHTTHLR